MLKLLMLKQYEKYLLSHKHYRTVPIWSLFTTYFLVGIWCVLEIGRSPGFFINTPHSLPSFPSGICDLLRITVAGQRRICTDFPFKPNSRLAPSLTHYSIMFLL